MKLRLQFDGVIDFLTILTKILILITIKKLFLLLTKIIFLYNLNLTNNHNCNQLQWV
jgi:hypothetical protein